MAPDRREPNRPKTLMDHVAHALRENRAWRPMSFYLLIAIPLAMLAALPVFYTKEDPKRFALHLILIFVFLFIIVVRAVFDMIEIGRRNMAGRRDAFRSTLGEDVFLQELHKHQEQKADSERDDKHP